MIIPNDVQHFAALGSPIATAAARVTDALITYGSVEYAKNRLALRLCVP